jgi:hypothetical protein
VRLQYTPDPLLSKGFQLGAYSSQINFHQRETGYGSQESGVRRVRA